MSIGGALTASRRPELFVRYRRGFLIASSFLVLVCGSEVRLELLPIFGQAMQGAGRWLLYAFIWLACLYSALGYFLYFRSERYSAFRNLVDASKVNGVRNYLLHLADRNGRTSTSVDPCEPVSVWPMDAEVEVFRHFESIERSRGKGREEVVEHGVVQINRIVWMALVSRAVAQTLLAGITFYQYVLPVLWFVFAICFASVRTWPGSPDAIWHAASENGRDSTGALDRFQPTICDWGDEGRSGLR